jgi:hypothetical protein
LTFNARQRAAIKRWIAQAVPLKGVAEAIGYWQPQDAYADQSRMTKSLVFSEWQVVPDAIASFCSYEAERRMVEGDTDRPRYSALTRGRKPLLKFSSDAEDRLGGMPVFCLVYPCATLAREIDPLGLALDIKSDGQQLPSLDGVKQAARNKIERLLRDTGRWPGSSGGREDQKWYWAALALLDAHHAPWMHGWCVSPDVDAWKRVNTEPEEEPASGFASHVARFAEHFTATA